MAELRVQANQLREENERLRTQLKASRAERSREPPRPFPPSRPGKGKEAATPDDIDLPTDDELSSDSSPLPRRSPPPERSGGPLKKEAASPAQPVHQCCKASDTEATQQRPTTDHARSAICARPNRGPSKVSACHIPTFRGRRRSSNGICTPRPGTAGHAFHPPQTAYLRLRSPPRLFHTTFRHVRRLLRPI